MKKHVLFVLLAVALTTIIGVGAAKADPQPPLTSTLGLLQGSGPVQDTPSVHLIFWGSSWLSDSSGVEAAVKTEFQDLCTGTPAWEGIMAQYGVGACTYVGSAIDTVSPGGQVLPSSIMAEIQNEVQIMNWGTGRNQQFIVFPQKGSDMSFFYNECGEHNYGTSGAGYHLNWSVIPSYQDSHFNTCIYDYGADNGQNAPGTLVGASTSIVSHEYAETATDPHPLSGWADYNGNEIGDLCEWYSSPGVATVNMSYLYSNSTGKCEDGHSTGR